MADNVPDADDVQDAHNEVEDLKEELERFREEKERVRMIVGKIGGVPAFQTKVVNLAFAVSIGVFLVLSIVGGHQWRPLMMELTIVALSIKIVFLIHLQSKVNHFQLWVMSAIEWRINEITRVIKWLEKVHKGQ